MSPEADRGRRPQLAQVEKGREGAVPRSGEQATHTPGASAVRGVARRRAGATPTHSQKRLHRHITRVRCHRLTRRPRGQKQAAVSEEDEEGRQSRGRSPVHTCPQTAHRRRLPGPDPGSTSASSASASSWHSAAPPSPTAPHSTGLLSAGARIRLKSKKRDLKRELAEATAKQVVSELEQRQETVRMIRAATQLFANVNDALPDMLLFMRRVADGSSADQQ